MPKDQENESAASQVEQAQAVWKKNRELMPPTVRRAELAIGHTGCANGARGPTGCDVGRLFAGAIELVQSVARNEGRLPAGSVSEATRWLADVDRSASTS